jgi:hypothetical protein
MVITRSRHVRRVRDLLNPRFDPDVVHREVCTSCRARFPISADRVQQALAEPAPQESVPLQGPTQLEEPAEVEDDAAPAVTAHAPDPAGTRVHVVGGHGVAAGRGVVRPAGERGQRAVLVGRPTRVGAGRRSGPVGRPVGDRVR